jgi:hypothetical protein
VAVEEAAEGTEEEEEEEEEEEWSLIWFWNFTMHSLLLLIKDVDCSPTASRSAAKSTALSRRRAIRLLFSSSDCAVCSFRPVAGSEREAAESSKKRRRRRRCVSEGGSSSQCAAAAPCS